jgi:ComF family protein
MEIDNWLTNIQDWLLPRLCPGCHDWAGPGRILCRGCEHSLPRLGNSCPRCANPYNHENVAGPCGMCQRHPPTFARAIALYRYEPPVDHFIRELKFRRQLGMARLFGERLAERLLPESQRPDLILPVPLHARRLRHRGYNQALEIARPVARCLGVELDISGVERIRDTAPQTQLSPTERRRNLDGAFRAKHDYSGLSVALVDDVMTSGHTADNLARILLHAGANDVQVWVAARTLPFRK